MPVISLNNFKSLFVREKKARKTVVYAQYAVIQEQRQECLLYGLTLNCEIQDQKKNRHPSQNALDQAVIKSNYPLLAALTGVTGVTGLIEDMPVSTLP